MSKQTAVEWLVKQIENNVHHTIRIPRDYFDQAKAMEKEQIIKSMAIAFNDALRIQEGKESLYNDWKQYYNETYGGDK
jgi:hypothetical protein